MHQLLNYNLFAEIDSIYHALANHPAKDCGDNMELALINSGYSIACFKDNKWNFNDYEYLSRYGVCPAGMNINVLKKGYFIDLGLKKILYMSRNGQNEKNIFEDTCNILKIFNSEKFGWKNIFIQGNKQYIMTRCLEILDFFINKNMESEALILAQIPIMSSGFYPVEYSKNFFGLWQNHDCNKKELFFSEVMFNAMELFDFWARFPNEFDPGKDCLKAGSRLVEICSEIQSSNIEHVKKQLLQKSPPDFELTF